MEARRTPPRPARPPRGDTPPASPSPGEAAPPPAGERAPPRRLGPGAGPRQGPARALLAAGIGGLALAAWLALPRPAGGPPALPAVRALVVDASAGTVRRRPGYAAWLRERLLEEARSAEAAGEQVWLARFADGATRLLGPVTPEELAGRLEGRDPRPLELLAPPSEELASDLAGALALARRAVGGDRPPGEVVLLGLDRWTGADPAPERDALLAAGHRLRLVTPPPPTLPDLVLADLTLPAGAAAGEPLAARVRVRIEAGAEPLESLLGRARLALSLEVEDAGGRRVLERTLASPAVAAGSRVLEFDARVPLGRAVAGPLAATARVRLLGPGPLRMGDPCPEDDTRSAVTRVGEGRVLLAAAPYKLRAVLEAWLERVAPAGLVPLVVAPEALEARLGEADLLWTLDVPPGALPAELLADFVRSGGGWLATGGWGLLRGWHERRPDPRSPAGLLPLVPAGQSLPPRDVIFLVDGSGSMAGEPFDRVRSALIELAEVAPPRDRVVLRFFTGALGPPIPLSGETSAERRRAIADLLRRKVPGGDTALLYSLEELARERQGSGGEREAICLLLSDGRDGHAFDAQRRAAAILEAFAATRTRLVVIAVGADARLDLLRRLVAPGERLEIARDLSDLGELFHREVNRRRVREGEALETLALAPASAREERARAVLEAWAAAGTLAPPHRRHARCALAEGAELLARSAEGDPLVAWRTAGRGAVACRPTASWGGWAEGDLGARALFAPLLGALARRGEDARPRLEAREGRLLLLGVPDDWPPRVRVRIEGSAGRWSVPLAPPVRGLGEDPRRRREGPLPALPPGERLAAAVFAETMPAEGETPGGGGDPLALLPLAAPPPAEFSLERPLAPPPAERSPAPSPAGTPRVDPRAAWVLGASLLAAFAGALVLGRRRGPWLAPGVGRGGGAQVGSPGGR